MPRCVLQLALYLTREFALPQVSFDLRDARARNQHEAVFPLRSLRPSLERPRVWQLASTRIDREPAFRRTVVAPRPLETSPLVLIRLIADDDAGMLHLMSHAEAE